MMMRSRRKESTVPWWRAKAATNKEEGEGSGRIKSSSSAGITFTTTNAGRDDVETANANIVLPQSLQREQPSIFPKQHPRNKKRHATSAASLVLVAVLILIFSVIIFLGYNLHIMHLDNSSGSSASDVHQMFGGKKTINLVNRNNPRNFELGEEKYSLIDAEDKVGSEVNVGKYVEEADKGDRALEGEATLAVLVSGAGSSEVNGCYLYKDMSGNAWEFELDNTATGRTFEMFKGEGSGWWNIQERVGDSHPNHVHYGVEGDSDDVLPPTDGWGSIEYKESWLGMDPMPKVEVINRKACQSWELDSYPKPKHGRRERSTIGINVTFSGEDEINRLSPPERVSEQTSIQLDDELLILVGGFITGDYDLVSRSIQFFNITHQLWLPERRLDLPPGIAETHQGATFDPTTRALYIVSGQKGGACKPATTAVARINVDTGVYETLPPLPAARYSPGVALASDEAGDVKHLHVFGGASEVRNQSATDHWRLTLTGGENFSNQRWQQLEDVPDSGSHGTSIHHEGFIYYTSFSGMDQGVSLAQNMWRCQEIAYHNGQMLHHTSDVGFFFRYATGNQGDSCGHWERLPDMPFPATHTGFAVGMGRLILVGGGVTAQQVKFGSAATSLNMVQMFNFDTQTWETQGFDLLNGIHAYRMSVWIDYKRKHIFGLRSGETAMFASFGERNADIDQIEEEQTEEDHKMAYRVSYLMGERSKMVDAITSCINSELTQLQGKQSMVKHSAFEEGYEEARTTWNKRMSHLQYPDIVTFPESPEQISMIVRCAKKTGHHVCGRNGHHSFEGDSICTYGIVVDVAELSSVEILGNNRVRFGSGFHLGGVAVELEKHGLALPMGHCASVGMTGLVLVGGQGILSRHFGLTIDYVSAIELVDYSGQVIYATRTNEFSDFVWLARGGGSGVQHFPGIITKVEFDDLPKLEVRYTEEVYTAFKIAYTNPTPERAERLLLAWQDFLLHPANTADPIFQRLTVEPWMWWHEHEGKELSLACHFYGNDDLHQQLLSRFLPKILILLDGGNLSEIRRFDHLHMHRELGGVDDNAELASGRHGWDLRENRAQRLQNRWKGYSAVAAKRVPGKAFRALAEAIFNSKPHSRRYVEFKPLRGAIRNHNQTETAFWHRDAVWWVLSSHWHWSTDSAEVVNAIQQNSAEGQAEFVRQMGNSFSGSYAGYINHGNSTGRDLEQYYGGNAARIARIKKQRDPHNLFRLYLPNAAEENMVGMNNQVKVKLWRTVPTTVSNNEINRHEACFVDVNGLGYLIGGRGLKLVNVYDPNTRKWSTKNGPGVEINHMQCVGYDSKVWIVSSWYGEYPYEKNHDNIYIYDTNNDSWSTKDGMPENRRRGAAASVEYKGEIYVSHGNRGGHGIHATTYGWLDKYNIAEDRWITNLPTAPNPRDHTGGAIVLTTDGEHLLCVASGRNGACDGFDNVVVETDCFNLQKLQWSTHASIKQGRAGAAIGTTCDMKLMVAGGEGFGQAYSNVDVFDGTTWTAYPSLLDSRHGTGLAFSCGCNQVHIASGSGDQGGGPELGTVETLSMDGNVCIPTMPAPVSSGDIGLQTTSFAVIVTGAGSSEANGCYILKGRSGNAWEFELDNAATGRTFEMFKVEGSGWWNIMERVGDGDSHPNHVHYGVEGDSDAVLPPTDGWGSIKYKDSWLGMDPMPNVEVTIRKACL